MNHSGAPAPKASTLAQASTHPMRVQILQSMKAGGAEFSASPTNLASGLHRRLNIVAYHVNRLVEAGALELVGERPRNGAIESFYALTDDGWRAAEPLDGP